MTRIDIGLQCDGNERRGPRLALSRFRCAVSRRLNDKARLPGKRPGFLHSRFENTWAILPPSLLQQEDRTGVNGRRDGRGPGVERNAVVLAGSAVAGAVVSEGIPAVVRIVERHLVRQA